MKRRSQEEVTLNMAAMLDMAFQLLTFFILTFRPPPIEPQITMRLPPAKVVANAMGKNEAGEQDKPAVDIKGVDTLVITIFANPAGDFGDMGVGANPVRNVDELKAKVTAAFKDVNSPFEQVIIQAGPRLRYEKLMQIVDICAVQKHADGKKLDKLSFEEIPENVGK
jgi:biopolymer transport protein ExbD